ncbi:MAG: Tn3 family transposase [Proteobacteria bacterium]|nr:Tn3 family transposase [Pseudomonadota bacterium]
MLNFHSRFIGVDRLPRALSELDVDVFFRLPQATIDVMRERLANDHMPGAATRQVGLAVQVAFMRATGRPLDGVKIVPAALLKYLSEELRVRPFSFGSLRAIYKRGRTLHDHQQWAKAHLGLEVLSAEHKKALSTMLLAQASEAASIDELVASASRWLYDQKILIPADRTLRDLAREAFSAVEAQAVVAIKKSLSAKQRAICHKTVFDKQESGISVLEWLKKPPRRHGKKTLDESVAKIRYLKQLDVHEWDFSKITLPRQKAYARALTSRPPSETRKRKDDTQLLEIACFLRVTLFELTDATVYQFSRRAWDLHRHAAEKAVQKRSTSSGEYRSSLLAIRTLVDDGSRTPTQRLNDIRSVLNELGELGPATRAAMTRNALIDDGRVRQLLKSVSELQFQGSSSNTRGLKELETLYSAYEGNDSELPPDVELSVSDTWREEIDGPDRKRALRALEASTVLELRRGLRRGSIWIDHSMSYRELEQMLIPREEWERERARHLSVMGLPENANEFLNPLLETLKIGIEALAEVGRQGKIEIDDDGMLRLPKLEALELDFEPKKISQAIFKDIGTVQFPDLIVEVDALVNHSEAVLGRRARSPQELIAYYGALLAQGTDRDAKAVATMIPGLDPADVTGMMHFLEAPHRLERANQRVLDFLKKIPVTQLWGDGQFASSDMMALDASRNMFNARIDPRRRTFATGVYTHVLNSHALGYSQPVVLNSRQTGPAIHGAVRYNQLNESNKLLRLAVDTHGYSYTGMTMAKLGARLDLCPRLQDLKERKLYLPRSIDAPVELDGVVMRDVSLRPIRKYWDELLRWSASIFSGRMSANVAMERLGSASHGTRVHKAADQLGRLLRTQFLCDYFSNPDFRREVHTVLNRGESVHQLQRVIHDGRIPAARGRRRDELVAISGAHGLLTNLVLAWNASKINDTVEHWRKTRRPIEDKWVAHIGPAHFRHINFSGTMAFNFGRYLDMLVAAPSGGSARVVPIRR